MKETKRNGFVLYIFSLRSHIYIHFERTNKQTKNCTEKLKRNKTKPNETKKTYFVWFVWNIEEHFRKLYVLCHFLPVRIFSLLIWLYFAILMWKAATAAAAAATPSRLNEHREENNKRNEDGNWMRNVAMKLNIPYISSSCALFYDVPKIRLSRFHRFASECFFMTLCGGFTWKFHSAAFSAVGISFF